MANYLVANEPYTPEERWEEIGGYSPSTMAAEIAGLACAASIAKHNGATGLAVTYQDTARPWASQVDNLTYTTTGPYGDGHYFLRITQDGNPNSGADITIAYKYDLGGNWDNVEETSTCGYVDNRDMTVNGGTVNDTVAAWAGLDGC